MSDTRGIPDGMERTTCDCHNCAAGCKSMPGALIPGDLERIQAHVGDQSAEFVDKHFQASEGALVVLQGIPTRVPSLVPRQDDADRCVFLDADDRCSIHPVAPFCCSYVDTHQGRREGDERAYFAVAQQLRSHIESGSYAQHVQRLAREGQVAPTLAERWQKMIQLMEP